MQNSSLPKILKNFIANTLELIVYPPSYRYHFYLNYLIRMIQQKLNERCLQLYAINTFKQFKSGKVYEYKEVLKKDGAGNLCIDLGLAATRMHDIFLSREVQEILDFEGASSILEVGCEAGQNLLLIRDRFPSVKLFGCDISLSALEIAESEGIEIKQIDLNQVDSLAVYDDAQFDYVLVSHVLEHLLLNDMEKTQRIRLNIIKHIDRISKRGFLFTSAMETFTNETCGLVFVGNNRIALHTTSVGILNSIGIKKVFMKINSIDETMSIISLKGIA